LIVEGETVTEIAIGAVIAIVAMADFVPSATEVAVTVIVAGVDMVGGAVYVTAAPDALDAGDTLPHAAPLQPDPETVQVAPLFCGSFDTVAVKACAPPA
jgi:hypothetical protein